MFLKMKKNKREKKTEKREGEERRKQSHILLGKIRYITGKNILKFF